MLFKNIIGHQDIKNKLIDTVKQDRISHAQLFVENSCYGSLQLAIAYCQYISCSDRKDDDSCGVCPSCIKFNKLIHPDLHFSFPYFKKKSDDKTTTSDEYINQWREYNMETKSIFNSQMHSQNLRAGNKQLSIMAPEILKISKIVSKKSFESDYKFIIIWSAEKMNETLANKILKELEEPAPKTLFVLVSQKPEDILTTIISRCQILKIPKVDNNEIKKHIQSKTDFDDYKVEKYTKIVNGNLTKLSEVFYTEDEEDDTKNEYFEKFANFMRMCYNAGKNVPKIIDFAEDMAKNGKEYQKHYLNYCLYLIRENFMLNIRKDDLSYMFDKEHEFSKRFALFIRETNVFDFYQELNLAVLHVERNVNPKVIFFDLALKFSVILAKTKKLVLPK
jgi:DNA polymerase-3 subunit delta'